MRRQGGFVTSPMTKKSPLRYFRTSPEIIRLAVMMYIRFPLSLRKVEDAIASAFVALQIPTLEIGNAWALGSPVRLACKTL